MQRSLMYAVLAVSLTWAATQVQAQAAPAAGQAAPQAGPMLAPGTVVGAQLSKGIDAKKAKVGQQVLAKAVGDLRDGNGNVVISRGDKLVGHITEVKPASKQEPQSTLGVIFDKVETKGKQNKEIGMHAGIQALAKAPSSPMMQEQEPEAGPMGGSGGGPSGGGTMGGRPGMGTGGRNTGAPPEQPGEAGGGGMGGQGSPQGGSAGPALNANSRGVIGIPNLTLSPQASPTEGSIISSNRGNVKLDGGTLLVLRVIGQ